MGHKNKTYRQEILSCLKGMLAIGKSKHEDKKLGKTKDRIYSWSAYHTYKKAAISFCEWCKKERRPTDMESCRAFAHDYIDSRIKSGISPKTIAMERSALAKVFRCEGREIFEKIPTLKRTEITRGRGGAAMEGRYQEAWRPLESYLRTTGQRRSEAAKARGSDLWQDEGGTWRIRTHGKGGRWRDAPLCGSADEIRAIVDRAAAAAEGLIWPQGVPSSLEAHRCRADYAERVYKAHARPTEALGGHDRYVCRKDLKGYVYDRSALMAASEALGHGRVGVVVDHYLWQGRKA